MLFRSVLDANWAELEKAVEDAHAHTADEAATQLAEMSGRLHRAMSDAVTERATALAVSTQLGATAALRRQCWALNFVCTSAFQGGFDAW